MSKIYLNYGTMNSSKTLNLLATRYSYAEKGMKPLVLTSGLDDRYGVGIVASRAGLSASAFVISHDNDRVFQTVSDIVVKESPDIILIDEAQFLTKKQVIDIAKIADTHNLPIMAYALKNDFMNEMFEGTKYLMLYADSIREIKTVCSQCDRKATMNLRLVDGEPVYHGDQIQIGGNESYTQVCREHYFRFHDTKEKS